MTWIFRFKSWLRWHLRTRYRILEDYDQMLRDYKRINANNKQLISTHHEYFEKWRFANQQIISAKQTIRNLRTLCEKHGINHEGC